MNADFFWKMVKKEVERQKTSFEWLYIKTNIPKGTFSSWKSRNTIPRADEAYLIAQALNVSVEYLVTGKDNINNPSNPVLNEIIEKAALLDTSDLQVILAAVQAMTVKKTEK